MWNRTLVYLGLREEPDEIYDELPARFVPEDDPYARHAPERRPVARQEVAAPRREAPVREPELAISGSGERRERGGDGGRIPPADIVEDNVRPLRAADRTGERGGVRPSSRVAQIDVAAFDDVESVGARYRTGQAVLFDLATADAATARRVVDFVAGLTYALRGELTKVGSRAFLLVPDGVDVPADEQRRLGDQGYRMPTGSVT